MIFFHLPVPFEKGDIIMIEGGEPGVLTSIPHWWGKDERTDNLYYEDFLAGKRGDGSDMTCNSVYFGNDGGLIEDHEPFSLLDLRYYRKELKGRERFLKYLSYYIKENNNNIAWLINVFYKFQAEAESEKASSLFGGFYLTLEESEKLREGKKEATSVLSAKGLIWSVSEGLIYERIPNDILPENTTGEKIYSYYPRGRVEIVDSETKIYMNPNTLNEYTEEQITEATGIYGRKIRMIADGSAHY
jgi:hypothetical protein